MRGKDKALAFVLFILVDISLIGGIFYIRKATAKNNFFNEIEELASLDYTSDKCDSSIKATGKYGNIERGIKKYLNDYAEDVQGVVAGEDYLLLDILKIDTYKEDGPLFLESFKEIELMREKYIKEIDLVIEASSAEKIKKNLGGYVADEELEFTYELMEDNEIISNIQQTGFLLETRKIDANAYYDALRDVLVFLRDNNGSYTLNETDVIFSNNSLALKYEELVEDVKRIYE